MNRQERRQDPAMILAQALRSHGASLWSAIPGIVESVDLARQTVTVQPTIKARERAADGSVSSQPLPLLLDVPIVFPSGGGYSLTFPIEPGDECLVVFADRCIDAWWQSGGVQEQADYRMHDLSDGFAIFGPRSQPRALPSVSAGSVQLRSDDGESYVELSGGSVCTVHAPGGINLNGLQIDASGKISAPAGATIGGIDFASHHHSGVRAGGDTSGGPV